MPPKKRTAGAGKRARRELPKAPVKKNSTKDRMHLFLEAYAETCHLGRAAQLAGIGRVTHYRWLEKSPSYAAAFAKRKRQAGEYMEDEAVRRAAKGWTEPVFYQGAKCGSIRRYDGGLMQFLLRGLLPEKYGSKTEISGPQGAPVQAKIEVTFVRPGDITNGDRE
jgi:hypothetical protein